MTINKNANSQYRFLFGPVPSRRLGISLGIDMVPFKTCTMNCVYCECGATNRIGLLPEEYGDPAEYIAELDHFLASGKKIDVVTFGGSGEPTLNTALKKILDHIHAKYPDLKTALLTNSSLLYIEEIRKAVMSCTYVLPTLNAVSESVFTAINRPVSKEFTAARTIEGIEQFSNDYQGNLWVELFLVPGINDTKEELQLLKQTLQRIKCTRVQLNSLDRPGSCSWVEPVTPARLHEIANFLLPLPVEIISRRFQTPVETVQEQNSIRQALIAALHRRPMTVEDLALAFGTTINRVTTILNELCKDKTIETETVNGHLFYRYSRFPFFNS